MKENDQWTALFQEVGRHKAPDDLELRVVERIRERSSVVSRTPQLFGPRHWSLAAILFVVVAASGWLFPGRMHGTTPILRTVTDGSWGHQLLEVISSPWALAGCAVTLVLLLLDRALSKRGHLLIRG